MIVKNISGEERYFTFVPRGYLLDNFTRGRTLLNGAEITLPDDTQVVSTIQKYVAQGIMQVMLGPPAPFGGSETAVNVSIISGQNKDVRASWLGAAMARHPSGTGFILASSATYSRSAIGLSVKGAEPSFSDDIQILGSIILADWTEITGTAGLAALQPYFLDISGGKLTLSPSGLSSLFSQQVGYAINITTLCISAQPPILL